MFYAVSGIFQPCNGGRCIASYERRESALWLSSGHKNPVNFVEEVDEKLVCDDTAAVRLYDFVLRSCDSHTNPSDFFKIVINDSRKAAVIVM